MEHAGQVDRDDALPFSGIDVEKGGGLTDADAVEEYIQSAEFAHRRRNRGVDERAVAYIEIKRRSASAGSANLRGGRLGRGGIDIGADHRCAFTSETESTRPADPATRTTTSATFPSTRSMPTLPPMFLLRTISVTHLGSSRRRAMPHIQPLRSFLFAPGNHARRVEKALSLDADAVILDLEDAVAVAEKRATRDAIVTALARPRRQLLYVRVNAIDTEFCYGDLVAVVRPGLDGIILPKVETAAGLATIDWLLTQIEREHGLGPRSIDLIPIVETARGLSQIDQILATGTRVRRVAFGAGDFTLDVNMTWTREEAELGYPRTRIVTASRAAGIEPPLDTVWVDLADQQGLEASACTALGLGFQGKMCIHPNQIPVVNRVFTPSAAEIAFAERVVDAFARAERAGSAAIQVDGKFIDYPIVYRAQRILEKVAALRARERQ